MWKRLLLVLTFASMTAPALATDYSDIWWNPAEAGWGVNFVQNDNFIFATTFIYGADSNPTWVTAELTRAANGTYFGPVFMNTGPFFGNFPFDPLLVTSQQVGTANFQPTSPTSGNYSYSVFDTFVSKNIQRQTLVPSALDGVYLGGLRTLLTGCNVAGRNGLAYFYAEIHVVKFAPNQIQFEIPIENGLFCRFKGALSQTGTFNRVNNAAYTCDDGLNVTSTLSEVRSTSLGIEGRWLADIGDGCQEDVMFSGVRK